MSTSNSIATATAGGSGLGSIVILFFIGYLFMGGIDGGIAFVIFFYIGAILSIVPIIGFPIWILWGESAFIGALGQPLFTTNMITALATVIFFLEWIILVIIIVAIIWYIAKG